MISEYGISIDKFGNSIVYSILCRCLLLHMEIHDLIRRGHGQWARKFKRVFFLILSNRKDQETR